MKKVILFLFALSLSLFAKNENVHIMQFIKVFDDRYLAFRFKRVQDMPCKLKDLEIINLQTKPSCINGKKNIANYEKEHAKAIERLLQPGKNYYVTVTNKGSSYLTCDVSDKKKNIRLLLVEEGFAKPLGNDKELKKAYEKAQKNKKGMFSPKFANLTSCLFGEKKEEPKVQDAPDKKPEILKAPEKKIEININ